MHLDVIECYWRVSPLRKLSHVIVSICRKPGRIASLESFGTLELATDVFFLNVFLFCNVLQLEFIMFDLGCSSRRSGPENLSAPGGTTHRKMKESNHVESENQKSNEGVRISQIRTDKESIGI